MLNNHISQGNVRELFLNTSEWPPCGKPVSPHRAWLLMREPTNVLPANTLLFVRETRRKIKGILVFILSWNHDNFEKDLPEYVASLTV